MLRSNPTPPIRMRRDQPPEQLHRVGRWCVYSTSIATADAPTGRQVRANIRTTSMTSRPSSSQRTEPEQQEDHLPENVHSFVSTGRCRDTGSGSVSPAYRAADPPPQTRGSPLATHRRTECSGGRTTCCPAAALRAQRLAVANRRASASAASRVSSSRSTPSPAAGSSMKTLVVTLSIDPRSGERQTGREVDQPAGVGVVHLGHVQDHRLTVAELLADDAGFGESGELDGDRADSRSESGSRRVSGRGLHGQRALGHRLLGEARGGDASDRQACSRAGRRPARMPARAPR